MTDLERQRVVELLKALEGAGEMVNKHLLAASEILEALGVAVQDLRVRLEGQEGGARATEAEAVPPKETQ